MINGQKKAKNPKDKWIENGQGPGNKRPVLMGSTHVDN
jgi:hypothetical protein